ncbi:MAG: hypothetical protein SFY80_05900 [Verrucomicrobiota bacterium]|nr:hypothetical protein [Verrucomicrobiota bacterium]
MTYFSNHMTRLHDQHIPSLFLRCMGLVLWVVVSFGYTSQAYWPQTDSLHENIPELTASRHRQQAIESNGRISAYGYDYLYRLDSETIAGDLQNQNGALGYSLDKVGNRLTRLASLGTITNQDLNYNARDWLDGWRSAGFQPAAQGVSPGATEGTDEYDFENRLVKRTKPDGTAVTSNYDGDGLRIQEELEEFDGDISSEIWDKIIKVGKYLRCRNINNVRRGKI